MNKAVPWNVNGVGFDAREAAREAARRQGKSLGEWLHGVIAERADDIGVAPDAMESRQRVEAVTSKLERLSQRSADHDQRLRHGRRDDRPVSRRDSDRDRRDEEDQDDLYDRELARRPRRSGRSLEASDPLLEDAIESMERRAQRAERRADEAMQSVAELLRRNETRRDQERDSVTAFAQKLSDIETRLKDGFPPVADNPIKGALARLEARLDRIGRRGAAEANVAQPATVQDKPAVMDNVQRLEEKLNTILEAVHGRVAEPVAQTSPIAMTAARAAASPDRRLGDAIAEIAQRQQMLDAGAPSPVSLEGRLRARRDARERPAAPSPTPFAAMQSEIAALAAKIENLPRDLIEQHRRMQPTADLDAHRADMGRDVAAHARVAELEETVRGLVQRIDATPTPAPAPDSALVNLLNDQMRDIRDLVAATTTAPSAVDRIERQLAALTDRLDQPVAVPVVEPTTTRSGQRPRIDLLDGLSTGEPTYDRPAAAEPFDTSTLEALVRDLSRKMEAVQSPEAHPQALDALQDQIATLATRFDSSDGGIAKLASLERSMRDLFVHLEETRASVETSAVRAAREVLRVAMDEGRAQNEQGAVTSLATMQVMQDEAEARTKSTLTAVHDTLEKVVDRLAVMETDMADLRTRKSPIAAPIEAPAPRAPNPIEDRQSKPKAASLASADSFLDQILGQRTPDLARKSSPKTKGSGADARPTDLDAEAGRADFIAAARRAARAAQTDASLDDFKASAASKADDAVRAGLVAQSRDYVARHKRPVLLGMAALFVIVGTMAVMQRLGFGSSDVQTAAATPPAVSRTIETQPSRRTAELTPSALPRSAPTIGKPIPGSDPIQTGSISSLPSFAAQGATQMAPRPSIPAGLKTMANAGDGAAEYVLATHYAEGRLIPRDLKVAATWYQKAAQQGIVPAQYRLASLYEKGLGVTQDKSKARALYIQAAEAGNPRAMHNLAVLLADGDGKPDYEGAATWFRKAAQYGVHDSQYNLAILLARGLGTQQSLVQSYQWFAIAAMQNDSDAAKKRDEVGSKLAANDLAVAKALASSFRPKIADVAATDVQPPPGGWDGASVPSPVNSGRSKISSL